MRKTHLVAALGLTILTIHLKGYVIAPRILTSGGDVVDVDRIRSYSTPGSIAAVINTAKMGTGGLQRTFATSWKCPEASPVPFMAVNQCKDDRRYTRTHWFGDGARDVQKHREEYPEGKCLIVTAIRSPASWFGSMYLQKAKQNWRPKEEMLKDYKKWLDTGDFHMLYQVLPELLNEFNAGSLADQTRIMDDNGGYSFVPAPEKSMLAGCDLLFLRIEQSDRWPDIFESLDPEIKNNRRGSRLQDNPDKEDEIKAIEAYELTSEEKVKIYNSQDEFLQNWFDVYGFMDDVTGYDIEGRSGAGGVTLTAV